MRNQANVLQYIPVIPTRKTNPTLSIWQRARSAVSYAVEQARAAMARVVAVVTKKTSGIRVSIARAVRATMVRRPWVLTRDGVGHVVSRALSWCGDAWRRAGRPFIRVRVVAIGIAVVAVGLVVSPVVTPMVLAGCGAALVGLSRLIAALEASKHPSAEFCLKCIEAGARILLVTAYVVTASVVVSLSLVSVAFAATEILELALRHLDVASAASIAALAFFVLTANWGFAVVEVAWLALVHVDKRHARTRAQERQAIPLIRIDAERAWNGESGTDGARATETKVVDVLAAFASAENAQPNARTGRCMGCDLDDGGARFGVGQLSSLCSQCFSYLVEDELVNAAEDGQVSAVDVVLAINSGIQVPASVVIASGARLRSTRIDLDAEDVTCRTAARADSEKDPARVYWAETAWWFDGRGNRRARRWHGFVGGRLSARVEYEHAKGERGFYAVSLVSGTPESWDRGPYRALAAAQEAAADEISDHRGTNAPGLEVVPVDAIRSVS